MFKSGEQNARELLAALRAVFVTTPWVGMALMFVLEAEQWEALLSGQALEALHKAVKARSAPALDAYRLSRGRYADDLAQEVMIRLVQGKFLKCYDPCQKHPRVYLMGSAFQYARTLARSFWRSDGRTGRFDDWG
jgi:hypothetical protein